MELELSLVAGPHCPDFAAADVSVKADDHAGPQALAAALRDAVADVLGQSWPGLEFTCGGLPLPTLVPGKPPLVNGAVLVAGGTNHATAKAADAMVLAVLSGPDSGTVHPLHRGRYRIGRGRVEISITDPALSRLHGVLSVGQDTITLRREANSSGFSSDLPGAAFSAGKPQTITVGQVIRAGSSSFELRLVPWRSPAPAAPSQEPLLVQRQRGSVRGRWGMAAMACIPMLLGLGLALLTGMWMFLAFSSMSAITACVPLFGGRKRRRRFRADLRAATEQDAARRLASFPSAADLAAPGLPGAGFPDAGLPGGMAPGSGLSGTGSSGGYSSVGVSGRPQVAASAPRVQMLGAPGFALRVGTAAQEANVAVTPSDADFSAPLIDHAPVVVRLSPSAPGTGGLPITGRQVPRPHAPELQVTGPRPAVDALLRFALMQLDRMAVRTVVYGPAGSLPLAARFLPDTALAGTAGALRRILAHPGPAVVCCLGEFQPPADAGPDTVFIRLGQATPQPDATAVVLHEVAGQMRGMYNGLEFVPDGVSWAVFDRYARARAATASASGTTGAAGPGDAGDGVRRVAALPQHCTLPPPGSATMEYVSAQWARNAGRRLAPVDIGMAGHGSETFSFAEDGPHLLVAGTTGSGKSEFLRTLVGSLALHHSPEDLSFVFLDFKGGAGLGPLQRLPHATSLVTDIAGHGMSRTLASLRSEICRREMLLAAAEAADLDAYQARRGSAVPNGTNGTNGSDRTDGTDRRDGTRLAPLPRLVLVIDEFRVLADQYPDAMAELLRIAAVGRSLGIHLVMATQRPQGAISNDIRANVSTAVCLRVQSSFDSQDVIGAAEAAAIPPSLPGRAYISRSGAAPVPFQCAALRLPRQGGASVVVHRTRQLLADFPDGVGSPDGSDGTADITELAGILGRVWADYSHTGRADPGPGLPSPVVAQPLPVRVRPGELPDAGTAVCLGLLDVPEAQTVLPLAWDPAQQSHLACIGPAGSGASQSLAAAAAGVLNIPLRPGSGGYFLYVLDGDGSLQSLAAHPAVACHVDTSDPRTGARLLRRLGEETGASQATLVLCVSNWGRWSSAFRSSPWPWAEDLMNDLARDGGHGGLVLLISGERELLTSRFMGAIPNRLFFPKGASAESRSIWPRFPEVEAIAGRAVVQGPVVDGCLMNGCVGAGVPGGGTLVSQLVQESDSQLAAGNAPGNHVGNAGAGNPIENADAVNPPLRLRGLPAVLSLDQMPDTAPAVSGRGLLLGLGGDGFDPVSVRLRPGSVFMVLGRNGSGKTTFLDAIEALNPEQTVFRSPADGPDYWVRLAVGCGQAHSPGRDSAPVTARESGHEAAAPGWALVDDVDHLPAAEIDALRGFQESGWTVIATSSASAQALARIPLGPGARNPEQGLVLAAGRPADGELFGVRLDASGAEPPGRGALVDHGQVCWLQIPLPGGSQETESKEQNPGKLEDRIGAAGALRKGQHFGGE